MLKILRFFVSLYVWITAGGMFLLVILYGSIVFRIFPVSKTYLPFRAILRLLFIVALIPVKRINYPKVKKGEAYLYLVNHSSIADVPLIGAFLPRYAFALEAASHFNWPIYKYLISGYGQIPINRESVRDSLKSMQKAADKFKEGESIIIFPEGHRSPDGNIQEFKKLPFLMAIKAEMPIIPVSISGAYKISPNDKFTKRPARVTMKFGDPITPEQYKDMTADELKDHVFEIVKNGLV